MNFNDIKVGTFIQNEHGYEYFVVKKRWDDFGLVYQPQVYDESNFLYFDKNRSGDFDPVKRNSKLLRLRIKMLLGYEMVTVESRNNASSAETFTYDDIEWSW